MLGVFGFGVWVWGVFHGCKSLIAPPFLLFYLRQNVADDDDEDGGGEEAHQPAREVGHQDRDEDVYGHVPKELSSAVCWNKRMSQAGNTQSIPS